MAMIEVPVEKDKETQEKTLMGLLGETIIITGVPVFIPYGPAISINGVEIVLEKSDWGMGNFSKPVHVTGKLVRKNIQFFNREEQEYFVLENARV